MSYLAPKEFVTKMVDAGEAKIMMSTKDTLIRAYMAGAILALAAAFAVTVTVNTGNPLIGALLFGAFDAFQVRLQTEVGSFIPGQVFLMMPYLLSIAALIVVARRADYPRALLVPYFRGQR